MADITIGYWSIRGLGAPLRMMVSYSGQPYSVQMYDCVRKDDGWDLSSWFSKKPALKEKNPLMNLPYICDSKGSETGGELYISQTNACFLYLGRKLGMLGSTPQEMSMCEQLLCEVMDVQQCCGYSVWRCCQFQRGSSSEALRTF